MEFPFSKIYPDFAGSLNINENYIVTIVADEQAETVQLESAEEAEKLVAEFEDPDGDMMHKEGSIFGKYEQLHKFRP